MGDGGSTDPDRGGDRGGGERRLAVDVLAAEGPPHLPQPPPRPRNLRHCKSSRFNSTIFLRQGGAKLGVICIVNYNK